MMTRSALPLRAVIPRGMRAVVTARPYQAFRPDRLTISPESFPVPALRRLWTWPLVKAGRALRRGHRVLAKALRVDLYASHERREYIADHEGLDASDYEDPDIHEDEDGMRYRVVAIPLNRRERFLEPIGRVARRFSDVRLRWQLGHVALLTIHDITVSNRSAMTERGALPADLFAAPAIDQFVTFDSCAAQHDIAVTIENGSQRTCHLVAAFIGATR